MMIYIVIYWQSYIIIKNSAINNIVIVIAIINVTKHNFKQSIKIKTEHRNIPLSSTSRWATAKVKIATQWHAYCHACIITIWLTKCWQ